MSTFKPGQTELSESSPGKRDAGHVESYLNGHAAQHRPTESRGIVTDGHSNQTKVSTENGGVDGVVPVDEIDTASPRVFFPWIEQAEDTKL